MVDKDRVIYKLTVEDIYMVGEQMEIEPEKFTEEIIDRVQKGVEAGLGYSWAEVMETAIEEAFREET